MTRSPEAMRDRPTAGPLTLPARKSSRSAALARAVATKSMARRFQPAPGDFFQAAGVPAAPAFEIDPRYADVATITPLGDGSHVRLDHATGTWTGWLEICELAQGFLIIVGDCLVHRPFAGRLDCSDMLTVHLATEIDFEYVSGRGETLDLKGTTGTIVFEPAGMPPTEWIGTGRSRGITLNLRREVLARLYAGGEGGLPVALQAFLSGDLRQTVARRFLLNPVLLRCLEDLLGCRLEDRSRRIFFEAKALEILCHTFEALVQDEMFGSLEASASTTRGVLKAKQMLTENFVTPPSIPKLAQIVGMSRTCLCTGFRQIVGQSVFDYVTDLRMQRALELMRERDTSITQIAYAVGFGHVSSFTVAIQRRFGMSPSELRRRGLPSD